MSDPASSPEYQEVPLPSAFLPRQVFLFLTALSFLTRLAPARPVSMEAIRLSCFWFPVVGLALGIILWLPAVFFAPQHAGAALWAVGWVAASAWLTRALHYDGLADVLDALGSGKTGEGFRVVLKDSRIGTFGTLGLCLVVLGQVSAVALLLLSGKGLGALVMAPVFGRCAPILLARLAPAHPKAGLGAIVCLAPWESSLVFAPVLALVTTLVFLPMHHALDVFVVASIPLTLTLAFLARIARREGGLNGDYFGFAIIAGECSVLFTTALMS